MLPFNHQLSHIHENGYPVKWDVSSGVLQVIPLDKAESAIVGKIIKMEPYFITIRFPLRMAMVARSHIKEITYSTMDEKYME